MSVQTETPAPCRSGYRRRLPSLRSALSRSEWARTGSMFGFVLALHVIGFALQAGAMTVLTITPAGGRREASPR